VNQLVPIISAALPTLVAATGEQASIRFLEFFTANIVPFGAGSQLSSLSLPGSRDLSRVLKKTGF
jgi:hypothetical protein